MSQASVRCTFHAFIDKVEEMSLGGTAGGQWVSLQVNAAVASGKAAGSQIAISYRDSNWQ